MVSQVSRPQSEADSADSDRRLLVRLRHTCAHVLAMAVQTLFPEAKVTIGPCTDTGFYYDFDRADPFTPEDLQCIEAEMRRIIQANLQQQSLRVEVDASGDRLGKQIRTAELEKIPVVAIVGKREVDSQTLSVRTRQSGDLGTLTVPEVVEKLQGAIAQKAIC